MLVRSLTRPLKGSDVGSRLLQIQHQPQPQVPAAPTGPTQNPLLFLAQQKASSPPPTAVFASSAMFEAPAHTGLPPQQASAGLQHSPWQQTLEISSSGSPSSSCYASSLSPVASAAYLLEAHLHISQQPHPVAHSGLQQQPLSATQGTFPILSKPTVWRMGTSSGADPDMQELGLSGQQQQLSSCVMVK